MIVSTALGTSLLYASTRWRPHPSFAWSSVSSNFQFGAMYQGQAVAHFAKDSLIPALGGVLYGSSAVGYLTWASQLAYVPLVLTTLVARVSYPALARLQYDTAVFLQMLESVLKWTARVSLPVFAVLAALTPQIIQYVYGSKWLPAERSLYLLYPNMILGVGTGVLMPALYSRGRASTGLRISLAWAAATWVVAALVAAMGVGLESIAIAYTVGTLFALVLIVAQVRKIGNIRLARAVAVPAMTSISLVLLLRFTSQFLSIGLLPLVLAGLMSALLGMSINVWPDRAAAIAAVKAALRSELGSHHDRHEAVAVGRDL
jgi:O-antigen/teichoic acid export membrane protein